MLHWEFLGYILFLILIVQEEYALTERFSLFGAYDCE